MAAALQPSWKPLQRRRTLAAWSSLESHQKNPWLLPRLILLTFALAALVVGCILEYSSLQHAYIQNPALVKSKNALLSFFGELITVPAAATLATGLVYTAAEIRGPPPFDTAEGCLFLLLGLTAFHSQWILYRGAALFHARSPAEHEERGAATNVLLGALLLVFGAVVATVAVFMGCALVLLAAWRKDEVSPRRRSPVERRHEAALPVSAATLLPPPWPLPPIILPCRLPPAA